MCFLGSSINSIACSPILGTIFHPFHVYSNLDMAMVTFKSEKERLFRMIDRQDELQKERTKCEIWARVVGYIRPVKDWNAGKKSEYSDRKEFDVKQHGTLDSSPKGKK